MYLTGYSPEIKLSPQEINKQALQCNEKKTNSKQVQELSVDLYFSVFVKVLPYINTNVFNILNDFNMYAQISMAQKNMISLLLN